MILTIIQPAYLPWMGFFRRIMKSDKAIMLDTVQLDWSSRTKFVNRNRIKTEDGPLWLTVPLLSKGERRFSPISQICIDGSSNWQRKHLGAIAANYSKSPFFKEHRDFLEELYEKRTFQRLGDLLKFTLDYFFDLLGLSSKVFWYSSYPKEARTNRTGSSLILDMCLFEGADTYISGPLGRDYLEQKAFKEKNIEVLYDSFRPTPYPQRHGGFYPYVSIIDGLFNMGSKGAEEYLIKSILPPPPRKEED